MLEPAQGPTSSSVCLRSSSSTSSVLPVVNALLLKESTHCCCEHRSVSAAKVHVHSAAAHLMQGSCHQPVTGTHSQAGLTAQVVVKVPCLLSRHALLKAQDVGATCLCCACMQWALGQSAVQAVLRRRVGLVKAAWMRRGSLPEQGAPHHPDDLAACRCRWQAGLSCASSGEASLHKGDELRLAIDRHRRGV